MNRQIRRFLLLGALTATLILAQSDSGRISGTITDASSAVVPNAPVTVKNERTGQARKVTANGQGVYLVTQLGPSTYTVTAEVTGMAPAENSGVTLQVGQERTLNITVQPASVATEVKVSSGDLVVIDTSSAAIGMNRSEERRVGKE